MGLLARYLEQQGLPTATVSGCLDITQKVKPPRTAFVNYPLGHPTGKPFDLNDQIGIVRSALALLETATEAPTLQMLPNSWEEIQPGWEERAYRNDQH